MTFVISEQIAIRLEKAASGDDGLILVVLCLSPASSSFTILIKTASLSKR